MVQLEVINNELKIDKNLTKLDIFVIESLNILKKYVDYVIISGYVSIFFGRARGTEDVDIFINKISKEKFSLLYDEAIVNGYEFNIDNADNLYDDYLMDNLSINLWKKNFPLMRIEIKLATKISQLMTIKDRIKVFYNHDYLFFSPIEYQIAYKRLILKSDKDMEDARHLEIVFKNLDNKKIDNYGKIALKEFNDE